MKVASQAFEHLGAGGLLIVESRETARAMRQSYDRWQRAAGSTVWRSARVLTLDDWLAALWQEWRVERRDSRTLVSDAQAVRAFERIVDDMSGARLLNVRATAHAAVRSWRRVLDWRIEAASWVPATDEERSFRAWTRRRLEELRQHGWIDRGQLGEILSERLPRSVGGERVALLGFDQRPPALERLLSALGDAGASVNRIAAPRSEARCLQFAAADPAEELIAAARWARAALERDADATIAIIVPDLEERRAAVRATFDYILDPGSLLSTAAERMPLYAIVGGESLADYAVVDTALKLVTLGDAKLRWTDVGLLLRSPYLPGWAEEAGTRARLDRQLRRLGSVDWTSTEVSRLARNGDCRQLADAIDGAVAELGERRTLRGIGAWIERVGAALRRAGWTTGRPLTSVEHQTAERFRELLPELASLDELLSPMDLRTLRRELERLAAETRFQADSGDPPVHVLDALEHPGPSYDGLWITGLTADRWPAAAAPDPFLPLDLQRSLGMPWASAAGELERARRATDRLLGAAGEVVVSWPALIEEAHTELSALVPSNLAEYAAAGGGRDYGEELYAARRIEEVEDPGPALAVGDDPLPGGARVAELQAKCPFRAFAELRLGARRLESPTPGIAPFIRGQIVHAAFERVWRALGSQERLKAIAPDDLSRLIDAAVDGACTALGLSKPRRLVALERAWLAKVIAAVLDVEKSRAPFRVADLEVTERCVIGTATLALKIDRIDELDAGGEFIIDYKTGKPSARRWLGKGRDLPQLPLYATARPNPPVGLAFAHVNLRAPGFVGMAADAAAAQGIHEPHKVRDPTGNVRSFAAQLADWREWLVRLVGDHVAGVARVDPISAETCRECALAALCRVGADAVAETENSDDE